MTKPAGGVWSTPVTVAATGSCPNVLSLITVGDTLYLAWSARSPAGHYDIFYSTWSVAGNWASPLNVSNSGSDAYAPQLRVTSDGTLHLVWGVASYLGVYYSSKPRDGTWSVPLQFPNPEAAGWPSLAIDASETLHVVWWGAGGIYYASKPSGGQWSTAALVSDCTGTASCSFPVIDATGDTLHLFWHRRESAGPGEIYYTNKTGLGAWTPAVNVSANSGDSFLAPPGLAVAADGTVRIVWVDYTTGNRQIFYSVFRSGTWSSSINVSNSPSGSDVPSLTIDINGNGHAVWSQSGTGLVYQVIAG